MVILDGLIISHLAKIVKLLYTNADMNFWDKFEKCFTCLAPMEGVTDIAFSQVVAKASYSFCTMYFVFGVCF